MDRERLQKVTRLLLRSLPGFWAGPELFDFFQDFKRSRTDLDQKIEQAFTSLRNTSALVEQLETALVERTDKLDALRKEVERLSQLAAVEEQKAAPLLRELEQLAKRGRTRERAISFVISLVAGVMIFLLGAIIGPRLFTDATVPNPDPDSSSVDTLAGAQSSDSIAIGGVIDVLRGILP